MSLCIWVPFQQHCLRLFSVSSNLTPHFTWNKSIWRFGGVNLQQWSQLITYYAPWETVQKRNELFMTNCQDEVRNQAEVG